MHDAIRDFTLQGETTDNNLVQTKENIIKFVEDRMRDEGFIPVLDIEPQFTLNYVPEDEKFIFMITVYGVHVGDGAWQAGGMMGGKIIMKSSPPTKSNPS